MTTLPDPEPTSATSTTDPADVVVRFLRALTEFDVDTALDLVADDLVYANVSLPTIYGRDRLERIARPWLRAGLRWVLPFPGISPYLAASYQQPLAKDKPVAASAADLDAYLGAQGAGQEFQRLWTLGLGISF